MRHLRKAGMCGAAVALAASGVVLLVMPASAATGPHGKTVCTTLSGSVSSGHITISGCSGTAVPGTGGSSMSLSISLLAAGGPVTWTNGKVTTFGAPVLGTKKATHCPGYVKGATSEPSLTTFTGAVTADNSGLKVPGKYKGYVCIGNDPSSTFSAPKPLKIS